MWEVNMQSALIEKIQCKKSLVGIVGLGYVGLPLALRFSEAGFPVIGFDIDMTKIELLSGGKSYIKHIADDRVVRAVKTQNFHVTVDFNEACNPDILILCVPTPLGKHREPDMSYIVNTMESLLPHLRTGQAVILESTTYPGTTEEEIRPRLESKGFDIGKNIFLVYSPEREDPGNPNFSTQTIPKVVGGSTQPCLEIGVEIYSHIIDKVVPVSSTQAAEMTKLLENIYRAVNISLVNELKMIADRMNLDIWEIVDAAATKPFGFNAFYPGPGLGGHCIPIDPFYLTWKASEYNIHTRFIELAGEINTAMPQWVISKVADSLNKQSKSLNNSKILILGLAYKKNINDTRESPSVKLIELLRESGAVVYYSDPFVPTFPKMRKYQFEMTSVEITPEKLSEMDCVLVATDHDDFDYALIQKHSKLIVDTRGRYRVSAVNVVRA
jgi:UDP-N-acetyl-D-glucosamine dehydrogenase